MHIPLWRAPRSPHAALLPPPRALGARLRPPHSPVDRIDPRSAAENEKVTFGMVTRPIFTKNHPNYLSSEVKHLKFNKNFNYFFYTYQLFPILIRFDVLYPPNSSVYHTYRWNSNLKRNPSPASNFCERTN